MLKKLVLTLALAASAATAFAEGSSSHQAAASQATPAQPAQAVSAQTTHQAPEPVLNAQKVEREATAQVANAPLVTIDGKQVHLLEANGGRYINANNPDGSPISPDALPLKQPQFLARNIKETPASLDPGKLGDSNSAKVVRALFDTLVRQAPNGEWVGVAAKSWTVSPDGLTWTFHLRNNGYWHDGKRVSADDFVYAWQRVTDPKNGSAYADYLGTAHVKNAKEVAQGKLPPSELGVKALNELELQVSLTQPTPWFAQLVTHIALAPVRKDLIELYGDKWTSVEHFVGNGPYKLTENRVNDVLKLTKFDFYWDADNVKIPESTYVFVTDINAVYARYLAGELLTADIPPALYEKVLKERPHEVKSYLDPVTWFLEFNTEKVTDPQVRRAVKLLVNNKFLTDTLLKAGQPTTIFTPPFLADGQYGEQEEYFERPYAANVAEAVKLLQQAGYSKDKPFQLHLTAPRDQLIRQIVIALQSWFSDGTEGLIDFSYEQQESKILQDSVRRGDFQVRLGFRQAEYEHASAFLNQLTCNNSQNSAHWCNPAYDLLVQQANATVDAEKRAQLYGLAGKIIQLETPVAPIYVKGAFLLKSPALGGLSLAVKRRYLRDYFVIDQVKVAPTK